MGSVLVNGFKRLLSTVLLGVLLVKPGRQGNNPLRQIAYAIVGHPIGIHHQNGSTLLRGQCRFQILQTEAHQPVALSTRMASTFRSETCPMSPLRCPFMPEPIFLTARTIRNGLLERQLREPKSIVSLNPLFHPCWTPAHRGPRRQAAPPPHAQ